MVLTYNILSKRNILSLYSTNILKCRLYRVLHKYYVNTLYRVSYLTGIPINFGSKFHDV